MKRTLTQTGLQANFNFDQIVVVHVKIVSFGVVLTWLLQRLTILHKNQYSQTFTVVQYFNC